MGVLDKFLSAMRLNPDDDDDFYNEDYDYDDDYTEDEPSRRSIAKRNGTLQKKITILIVPKMFQQNQLLKLHQSVHPRNRLVLVA